MRREDGRQVATVAAADHRDPGRIDLRMRREHVVRGEQVGEVALARDAFALALRLGMAAEIEREAHAAERRDFPGTRQVLLPASAPAVDEEGAGNERAGSDQRAGKQSFADRDRDLPFMHRQHRRAPACT